MEQRNSRLKMMILVGLLLAIVTLALYRMTKRLHIAQGRVGGLISSSRGQIVAVDLGQDGQIAVATNKGQVVCYDRNDKETASYDLASFGTISTLAWHEGKLIAASHNGSLYLVHERKVLVGSKQGQWNDLLYYPTINDESLGYISGNRVFWGSEKNLKEAELPSSLSSKAHLRVLTNGQTVALLEDGRLWVRRQGLWTRQLVMEHVVDSIMLQDCRILVSYFTYGEDDKGPLRGHLALISKDGRGEVVLTLNSPMSIAAEGSDSVLCLSSELGPSKYLSSGQISLFDIRARSTSLLYRSSESEVYSVAAILGESAVIAGPNGYRRIRSDLSFQRERRERMSPPPAPMTEGGMKKSTFTKEDP